MNFMSRSGQKFRSSRIKARIILIACFISFAQAGAADPLAGLKDDAAKANYCLYTGTTGLQAEAARGGGGLALLPKLAALKSWESIVETLMPDRDVRGQQMIETLALVEERVTARTQTGLSAATAKEAVIEDGATACAELLAQLQAKDLQPRTAIVAATPAAPAQVVHQARAAAPKVIERNADSPFHKDVFAPGWRGDLIWSGSTNKERAVLSSFDNIPPGKDAVEIHANLRVFSSREHCVGHIVESGSSPDGVTLYAKPVQGNECGAKDRVVSLYAAAEDRMRMEIRDNGVVAASGVFAPTAHAARFTFTNPQQQRVSVAVAPGPNATGSAPGSGSDLSQATDGEATAAASKSPQVAPAPTNAKAASPKRNCLTCLPTVSSSAAADDLLTGLLSQPLSGQFDWNWQRTNVLFDRSQGTLARTSAPSDSKQTFKLTFDSKRSAVCTGLLRETGRSADGYLMHLKVDVPSDGRSCQPLVTHGYILPFTPHDTSQADFLWIKLYSANDKQVTESILRSDLLNPAVALDSSKAEAAWNRFRGMEESAKGGRKAEQLTAFQRRPDGDRLAPLYEGCMQAVPNIFGVMNQSVYCQCISLKFGVGDRLPQSELVRYSNDITPLFKLIQASHSDANKLYTRIGETCRQCSLPGNELDSWCSERDSLLYVASNYADMIRLLDKDKPIVEATDYYKKVFYRTYLQGFSALCPNNIVDPVQFDYVVWETDYGGAWDSPETKEVQRNSTFVAQRYARKYDRYRKDIDTPITGQQARRAINSAGTANEASLRRAVSDANTLIKTETENRQAISKHLAQQCNSESVRRVYANLLQLAD